MSKARLPTPPRIAASDASVANVELEYVLSQRRRALAAHDLTMSAAVTASWKRSLLHGLDPASTAPRKEASGAGVTRVSSGRATSPPSWSSGPPDHR